MKKEKYFYIYLILLFFEDVFKASKILIQKLKDNIIKKL